MVEITELEFEEMLEDNHNMEIKALIDKYAKSMLKDKTINFSVLKNRNQNKNPCSEIPLGEPKDCYPYIYYNSRPLQDKPKEVEEEW